MRSRRYLISAVYLVLSLCATLFGKLDYGVLCASDTCVKGGWASGQPWFFWGALYYAAVAFIVTSFKYRSPVAVTWLAVGLLVHGTLQALGGYLCPVCLMFSLLHFFLVAIYLLPFAYAEYMNNIAKKTIQAAAVIAIVLAVVFLPKDMSRPLETTPLAASEAEAGENFLQVTTPNGAAASIDLSQRPVLFFSTWCPHCRDLLKEFKNTDNIPNLVLTYAKEEDINGAGEELGECGLSGVDYYIAPSPPDGIEGVPSLLWMENGEMKHVEGKEAILKKLNIPILLGKAVVPNYAGAGAVNAGIAAKIIDGTYLSPGEVFSFNKVVGEREVSRGFVEARSVVRDDISGEYKMAPDVGGGVCRCSTALHLAVLDAGLEVLERNPHGLPVSYAKEGMDAAVAYDYLDYKFRNNTEQTIKIEVESQGEELSVELWGYY